MFIKSSAAVARALLGQDLSNISMIEFSSAQAQLDKKDSFDSRINNGIWSPGVQLLLHRQQTKQEGQPISHGPLCRFKNLNLIDIYLGQLSDKIIRIIVFNLCRKQCQSSQEDQLMSIWLENVRCNWDGSLACGNFRDPSLL